MGYKKARGPYIVCCYRQCKSAIKINVPPPPSPRLTLPLLGRFQRASLEGNGNGIDALLKLNRNRKAINDNNSNNLEEAGEEKSSLMSKIQNSRKTMPDLALVEAAPSPKSDVDEEEEEQVCFQSFITTAT